MITYFPLTHSHTVDFFLPIKYLSWLDKYYNIYVSKNLARSTWPNQFSLILIDVQPAQTHICMGCTDIPLIFHSSDKTISSDF